MPWKSYVSNNKDIAQSYFLGCHFDTVGWGKDSWWERLILCILLDLLSSVVALFLYLNFFSLSFKKLIVCFGGLAFLHCSSGPEARSAIGGLSIGQQWATVGKPENINTMERSKQLIQQPRAQTMERKHQCVKVILVIYAHDKKRIIMWREGYVEYYVSLTQEPMQWRNKNKRGYAPYIGVGQPWWQINVVSFHLSAPPRKPWGSIISTVPALKANEIGSFLLSPISVFHNNHHASAVPKCYAWAPWKISWDHFLSARVKHRKNERNGLRASLNIR